MIHSYLIAEEGLTKGMVFPLEKTLSIGRREDNDIRLTHYTVSRNHTRVYLEDGKAIVEDMDSRNGTYLNGKQIDKAVLSSGDVIWVGEVALRFERENENDGVDGAAETQELTHASLTQGLPGSDLTARSRRLRKAFSRIPFLSNFPPEQLTQVDRAAKLVLVKRGSTILREGDYGRSMYIIMGGKVEVSTQDEQGKDIHVSYLTANQFFGEGSFLTAAPTFASVQAVEDTLLCELGYESLKEIVRDSPDAKGVLGEYYRKRLRELLAKKGSSGVDG